MGDRPYFYDSCPGPDPIPHMKAQLVEKASVIVTDPQVLVNAVSKRVRQLNMGRPPLAHAPFGERYGQSDIALLEIIEGRIKVECGQ